MPPAPPTFSTTIVTQSFLHRVLEDARGCVVGTTGRERHHHSNGAIGIGLRRSDACRKARRENRHRERVYDLHDNSPALYRCRRHRPIEIFSPFLWVPATEMRCVRLHVQRLSRGCPLRVRYWGQNGRDADIEFLFNFEV